MKKIIVFDFEGLLYLYQGSDKKMSFFMEIFEKIKKLKEDYIIVSLTRYPRKKIEKVMNSVEEMDLIDKIYFLREFSVEDRLNILKKIEKDFSFKIFRYYIGEVYPFMNQKSILDFTRKVKVHKDLKYLDLNRKVSNSLISFDLDGVFNDISSYEYSFFEIQKKILEESIDKTLSFDEFVRLRKDFEREEFSKIKKLAVLNYVKNEKLVFWIKDYIKKLSFRNKLVLFSVTSRRRIISFLKRHELLDYFSKIYSGKDDFSSQIKKEYMFEKIKNDWREYKNFIHIGDQYRSDYLAPESAGFESYLVDNSPFKKVSLDEI